LTARRLRNAVILSHREGAGRLPGPLILEAASFQRSLRRPPPRPISITTGLPGLKIRHDPVALRIKSRPPAARSTAMQNAPPMPGRSNPPAKTPRPALHSRPTQLPRTQRRQLRSSIRSLAGHLRPGFRFARNTPAQLPMHVREVPFISDQKRSGQSARAGEVWHVSMLGHAGG
jgi:hypothetical protein